MDAKDSGSASMEVRFYDRVDGGVHLLALARMPAAPVVGQRVILMGGDNWTAFRVVDVVWFVQPSSDENASPLKSPGQLNMVGCVVEADPD